MLVVDSKIEIDLLGATSNDYDRYQSMEQLVATRYNMDRSEVVSMPQRIEWSLFKGETTYKDFADTPPREKFPGDGFMVVVVCVRKGGQYGWFPIEVHHCGFGHRMPSLSFEVKFGHETWSDTRNENAVLLLEELLPTKWYTWNEVGQMVNEEGLAENGYVPFDIARKQAAGAALLPSAYNKP